MASGRTATIRRTYAGRNQKANGAWTWFLYWDNEPRIDPEVGSQWPLTELRCGRVVVSANQHGQVSIDPYREGSKDRFGRPILEAVGVS